MYQVQEDPIDLSQVFADIGPETGAVLIFAGTVRADGMDVLRLETDKEEAGIEIGRIISEAESQWDLTRVQVIHRHGPLKVGEVIVLITVCSGHRDAAYAASRYIIDELKVRVPIWKAELFGETVRWVPGAGE
ncbi:MAG TPA: molybdenum cofactor biosynthesis protein MoaE [Methanospirillum sp.]|nr:molybdenum cofactor biosynthesis protein MoaE [Methanospirillum sp.]